MRRVLLILVVGLIVARPVVSGEDPGLLSDLTDPGGMILTLLTFVAMLGWACWRLWSGQGAVRAGLVDGALLVVVLLLALSTSVAAVYKRPGWLISWEWLGLWFTFFLVQQLSTTAEDQQGMLAAILAGAVALSSYGLYQAVVELPRKAQELGDSKPQRRAEPDQRNTAQTDPEAERRQQRVRQRDVSATFGDPGSFAGYLVLMLPMLVGAAVGFGRGQAPAWQTSLAAGCVLLGGVALWLTHRPVAIVILLLTAVAAAAWVWLRSGWARVGAVLMGAALVAAGGYGLARAGVIDRGRITSAIDDRRDVWAGTWRMMEGHAWLGLGPGRFGVVYPRFMAETAWEKPGQPHNLLLELWAAAGIFAAAALLVALGAFFWQLAWWRPPLPAQASPVASPPHHPTPPPEPARWEYYLGGMLGVLLGFLLRGAAALDRKEILDEAIAAGIRSVAWFAAFGLFEMVPWSPRLRVAALGTGVAALVAYLFVADGVGFPALAGPMWVAIALALASASVGATTWSRRRLGLALPIPILAAVTLGYAVFVVVPVTTSANAIHRAAVELAQSDAEDPKDRDNPRNRPAFVQRFVIDPLEQARRDDPTCARTYIHLSSWHRYWFARFGRFKSSKGDAGNKADVGVLALRDAREAQRIDPEDKSGFLAEYEIYKTSAQAKESEIKRGEAGIQQLQKAIADPKTASKVKQDYQRRVALWAKQRPRYENDVRADYKKAAAALRQCTDRDPTEASLRYLLAEALDKAGNVAERREEAEEALRLDKESKDPRRRLASDAERRQARRWTSPQPAK